MGQDYYLGYLVLLAHAYNTRVAFNCAFDTDCQPRQALTRRKYLWPAYALGLNQSDRILLQHQGQYQLLAPSLRPKSRLVPSFAGEAQPVLHRENYVAWVAVLRETKRPHLIVELARRLPAVRFVVCGPVSTHRTRPGYAAEIVSALRSCPNIEYRGHVSHEEAQSVMRHAAVLLSTSSQEGFPNTFIRFASVINT
jgi:glycosyltransferase involved in cell wall biosynthesis